MVADATLIASVREHGVLVPIVAVRLPDGRLQVRMGQRRTLAAVAAGRASVPVVVAGDYDGRTARNGWCSSGWSTSTAPG